MVKGKSYVTSKEGERFYISVDVTNLVVFYEDREGGRHQIPNEELDRRGVYAGISVAIDGKSIGYSKIHKIGSEYNPPSVFRYMTFHRDAIQGIETRSELRFMAPQVLDASTYGRMVPSNNKANRLSVIRVAVTLQRDTTEVLPWPSLVNNDLPIKVVDGSKKFFEVPSVTVASGLKSVVDINNHINAYKSQRLSDCILRSDIHIESETNLEILRKVKPNLEVLREVKAPRDLKRAREEVNDDDDDDVIEMPKPKKKIDVVDLL